MGKYLITGRSGSGKSTVCRELQRLGLTSLDSDEVTGLASWVEVASGKPAKVEFGKTIDLEKIHWRWDPDVLANLLSMHSDIFLCGSADNDLDFAQNFDMVFVLDAKPEVQRQRIMERAEHNYGKQPSMLRQTLEKQQKLIAEARKINAHIIDANRPIAGIIDEILSIIHDNK